MNKHIVGCGQGGAEKSAYLAQVRISGGHTIRAFLLPP
jgi:hypothetical protein